VRRILDHRPTLPELIRNFEKLSALKLLLGWVPSSTPEAYHVVGVWGLTSEGIDSNACIYLKTYQAQDYLHEQSTLGFTSQTEPDTKSRTRLGIDAVCVVNMRQGVSYVKHIWRAGLQGSCNCILFWQCSMDESSFVWQDWPDVVYGLNPVASC
jgi:hypothetical protein